MSRRAVVAAALALGLAPGAARAQAVPPHASWGVLPWSNGAASAAYDTVGRKLSSFHEHLYRFRDAATPTRELAYDAYFGLRAGGQNLWLTARSIDDAGWDGHAGIARVVQHHGDLRATQYFFSPFATTAPVVIAVVEVENTGTAALADAALFSIENLHLGGGDGTSAEHITWVNGGFEERGARGLALHRPLPAPTRHAASPDNPYALVNGGGHLVDTADSGVRDDAVAGFEWDLTGLAPGEVRRFAVALGFGDRAALDAALASAAATADADAPLAAARADWDAFFAGAKVPAGLSADQRAVYDRQLAVLRMGQIREPGAGHGQIVASLPPGMWNIAWVRDQSFATWALLDAGLDTEARDALAFLFGGTGGYVCCDRDGGPWVGAPYTISVTRYFGDGSEESDANAQGPNIEFDGFGLALATLADYVDATDDTAFVTAHDAAIFVRTADVLLGLVETTGAAAGLVRADSSIWETHWYDGGRQHWAFTQATAVAGLRGAARLADRIGRSADAARYRAGADAIAAAAVAALVDNRGVIRASLEQTTSALDAAAIGFLRWGLVPPDGNVAIASLDAWKAGLANPLTGHGYHRNDDGGPYDEREWLAIDLWIADAARAAGRADEANALVDWVTAQARANHDLVPENFDRVTADFQGEVPMVGFGAGAYVSSLWRQGQRPVDGDAGVDGNPGGDAGIGDDGGGGGCCRTGPDGGGAGGMGAIALGGLALARLRRRRQPR